MGHRFGEMLGDDPIKMARFEFGAAFRALTDYDPLRWQCRLFERMQSGEIPRVCDLPTGLGETSVIPIWLVALANQAQGGSVTLPRRLVYIVNRQTVVDQATPEAKRPRQPDRGIRC